MRVFAQAWRIARWLFGRNTVEARLADELTFHVQRQTEAYVRAGLPPDDARRRPARRASIANPIDALRAD